MLGILGLVVVFLIARFVREGLLYDPLEALKKGSARGDVNEITPYGGFHPAWSKAILEKNLFSRDRGYVPPVLPVSAPPPPPPVKPEFILKGIIMENGKETAIIENKGIIYALRQGDVLEEAEVTKIEGKTVVFKWMEQDITLSMEKVKTIKR